MHGLLEKVFAVHYKDVYRYLYSLSRDASLSEDLTQEVFLEAVKSAASFRGDADIKTWLFSIARNRWNSYLRKKNRQVVTEALGEFFPAGGQTPEERYQRREMVERIYALFEKEPERTREIVLMRLEGYSFFEIGRVLGISESSARVIDFRAKAKIRKILTKEGFTCE